MHRPGIASVAGDRAVLDGTTLEEVERYHSETLELVVEETNRLAHEYELARRRREEAEEARVRKHQKHVADLSKRIKFE